MPLVDYESSDEGSENDCKEDEKEELCKSDEKQMPITKTINDRDTLHNRNSASLFSALPKPRSSISFLADDNELSKLLLSKKSILSAGQKTDKGSVKILVPSVSEFSDDDEPAPKKPKSSVKGVGLFSVLPPPKNVAVKEASRKLVPNTVTKSLVKQTVNKGKRVTQKSVKSNIVGTHAETNEEEDDDDMTIGNSFFGSSLSKKSVNTELESVKYSENISTELITCDNDEMRNSLAWNETDQQPSSSTAQNVTEDNYSYHVDSSQIGPVISVDNNPLELDEKALHILCGGKKKRQQMPVNIIDLSGEEIMPDSKEWLLKQFTEEKKTRSHSHRKQEGPSTQQRRKHQITYLAFQAKEQELELQNQWANNRMSRKQTQSKYGF